MSDSRFESICWTIIALAFFAMVASCSHDVTRIQIARINQASPGTPSHDR